MVSYLGIIPNNINQPINSFDTNSGPQGIDSIGQNNIMQPINNINPMPNQPQPMVASNPIPPVNPMPMPGPTENTVPNPITPPQPVSPTPVGFVYGAQPNNTNNNM